MSKLCLGTYLTVLTLCKSNPKTSGQRKILNALVSSIIGKDVDISASEVSKIKKGTKDLENYISDMIIKVLEATIDFSEIQQRFDTLVIPLLHSDKLSEISFAIAKIIQDDESIGSEYIVDPIDGISKSKLAEPDFPASFLLGILIYILRYTSNVKCESYVEEISKDYIDSAIQPKTNEIGNKPASISAEKAFCLKYESCISLLPLCQIANFINPTHNHVNEMYTEYCQYSDEIQSKIMQLKGYPMLKFNCENIYTLLGKYESIIECMGLSSRRYLYAFRQYIPYTLNFEDELIEDCDPRIFPCEPSKLFPNRITCTLSQFIDDYLYHTSIGQTAIRPLDWLWENQSLSSAPDEDFMFWYNLFVLVSCDFIKCDANSPLNTSDYLDCPNSDELMTLEDLHYAMLLKLYQTITSLPK